MVLQSSWRPDRKCMRTCFYLTRYEPRCVYLLCLSLSVVSVLMLAYVTSFRLQLPSEVRETLPKTDYSASAQREPIGNLEEEKAGSLMDRLPTDSVPKISTPRVEIVRKPAAIRQQRHRYTYVKPEVINATGEGLIVMRRNSFSKVTRARVTVGVVPIKCTSEEDRSEILKLDPIKFLPNYKNPCWYELLTTPNVYDENKYGIFSRQAREMMQEMTTEWKKRLAEEEEPRRLRCLPYFLITGQPKCGSTDLYMKLTSHPDVFSTPIKEPHWWGKNRYGWRLNFTSTIPFTDYIDLFDKAAMFIEHVRDPSVDEDMEPYHQLITGDGSVSTFWDNDDWWRLPENCGRQEPIYSNADYIHHVQPDAKIIVILRDPTTRLYSDYLYFQKANKSAEEFHRSVLKSISVMEDCVHRFSLRACVYNRSIANAARVRLRIGIYSIYLEDWLKVFPKQQLLVLRLEDYASDIKTVMKQVFNFLGLRTLDESEENEILDQPAANTRRQRDKALGGMKEETKWILNRYYERYNYQLATMLNDSKFLWKT